MVVVVVVEAVIQEEGVWVWPDSGEATYTYWDQDYDEPLPGDLLTS